MNPLVETLNFYLAGGAIVAFLMAIILVLDAHKDRVFARFMERFGLIVALSISAGASIMALIYSEVFGFVPCGFCWLERIFLFPQVILILGALYFRDVLVARYGIILSVVGALISLYHHYIQMGGSQFVKCPSAGSVDCAKRILYEFDFVTFPLVGAAGFILLAAVYYYVLKTR